MPVNALGAISVSLDQAINRALQHSEDMRIQEENAKKMYNTYREVRAQAFPQVTGEVALDNYIESPVLKIDLGEGVQEIPLKQDYDFSAGATLSQVLLAFGKVNTAIDIARNLLDIQKIAVTATKNEMIALTKQVYFTALYARQSVEIAEQSYANALKNKKALAIRVQSGRASRMDNVKIEADVAGRVPVVIQAKKNLEQIIISFKNLANDSMDDELTFTDRMTDAPRQLDYSIVKEKMIQHNPVLVSLRKSVDLQDRMIRLRKAAFYPTLSGFATYNYGNEGDDPIPSDLQSEVIAGLRLNLTLWSSGGLSNAYRQARNDKVIAELEYKKMLEAKEVELRSHIVEYESLRQEYEANNHALRLAQQSYDITLSSFRSGLATLSVLNDAELYLTQAKLMTVTSQYNMHITKSKIEKLLNGEPLRGNYYIL